MYVCMFYVGYKTVREGKSAAAAATAATAAIAATAATAAVMWRNYERSRCGKYNIHTCSFPLSLHLHRSSNFPRCLFAASAVFFNAAVVILGCISNDFDERNIFYLGKL